jgi:hypothetical protein
MTMEGIESSEMVAEAPRESVPTMTQDQVRKVVQREKAEAIEKGRREAQAQYEQEIAALKQQQGSMGGMQPQIDEEKLYGKFFDRLMDDVKKQQFEQNMQNVAANYLMSMDKGKELYEDFEKVTSSFEPEAFPKVVQLVSQMENGADVIYELSKNPSKLVTINDLANRSPRMAQAQLQSLVESIKMNQSAKENNVRTNPPLSKHQPSATAGLDNGGMSIADFKRAKYLKA